jgi:hypothetical protein
MKMSAVLAISLIALPSLAFAEPGRPIQGTDVGLDHDPGNIVIAHAKTNAGGVAMFQNIKPGKYRLTVSLLPLNPAAKVEVDASGQKPLLQNISRDADNVLFNVRGSKMETVTVILRQR